VAGWSSELSARFSEHHETLRGAVRYALVDRQLGEHLPEPPARVCDVGGGSGRQSIPLARRGYEVIILDPSGEMLREARKALASEDKGTRRRVRLVRGAGEEAPDILGDESFDVVLCHGVLMYLASSEPMIRALAAIARPGAVVSVLFKNADALAMRPGFEGRYRDAVAAFGADRDRGGHGMVTRGDTVASISGMFREHGIEPAEWYGVRVLTDHLGDRPPGPDLPEILEMEWEAGRREPYRGVARLGHLIGSKRRKVRPAEFEDDIRRP
jgi:SAM-dependent methyltransferase